MRLLVKRDESSKKGMMGGLKRKFDMTFKLELTPAEQATVEKFGLQGYFNLHEKLNNSGSITYEELRQGKTISHEDVRYLFLDFELIQTLLKAANSTIKSYQLFPGEAVIEIP